MKMSQATKPLIFIEPLSDTLKKLKEVVEENAENEGIEVFEVDSLEEAAQLLPTIGQSLTLMASPKKCAMMLQSNRKTIKKLQSKTILLSPKSIPRKTLDKFMKVGLTECVVEPVNPKTLLYKVRLQLRSIATRKDEEEEMNNKIGQGDTEEQVDTNSRMRAEKGVILDEEDDTPTKEKKKNQEENVLEDYHKPKKKTYKEENISGFYKNKTKKREDSEEEAEEEAKKKGYQEEAIEGHYKGSIEKAQEVEEEEKERKRAPSFDLEDDIDQIKKQINDEVEDEVAKKEKKKQLDFAEETLTKKKSSSLDIEEDEPSLTQEKEGVEDLGGHYRGENTKGLEIEEEGPEFRERAEQNSEDLKETEATKKLDIVEDDPEKDLLDEREDEAIDGHLRGKAQKHLEIEEDEIDYVEKAPEAETEREEDEVYQLDVEEDLIPSQKKAKEDGYDPNEEEDKKQDAKADEIDGYLRGGAAKKNLDIEEDEDLYHDEALAQLKERKKKERNSLDVEEDIEKDPLLQEKTLEEEYKREKTEKLSVVEDHDSDHRQEKGLQEEEDDFGKKSQKLDIDDEGFSKREGAQAKEKEELGNNRTNARADHIKTHYSSKESIRHDNNDWGNGWDKKGKAQDDFPTEKSEEKELIIESEDLGEQTIDYGQLKKEFEGITIDGIPNKKKNYGLFDNVAEIKTYTKTVLNPEGQLEEMAFEEIQKEVEDEEKELVFEPDSKGMEIAIEVLDFYFDEKADPEKLCAFISQKVSEKFSGDTIFYTSKRGAELTCLHNGFIENGAGKEPVMPSADELESLSRGERKEIEDDFKKDHHDYEKQRDAYRKSWEFGAFRRFDQWKEMKTPQWLDHTFQASENEFVFPFYEGVTLLGLAVFVPKESFNPEKAESLEAIFEAARGLYLTEYYHEVGSTKQREKTVKPPEQKKGGFFSKFFKRGA